MTMIYHFLIFSDGSGLDEFTAYFVVGGHDLTSNEPQQEAFQAQRITSHAAYNNYRNFDNDIALIYLDRKVTFSEAVQPLCLPDEYEMLRDNTSCVVTGWGADETGKHYLFIYFLFRITMYMYHTHMFMYVVNVNQCTHH